MYKITRKGSDWYNEDRVCPYDGATLTDDDTCPECFITVDVEEVNDDLTPMTREP